MSANSGAETQAVAAGNGATTAADINDVSPKVVDRSTDSNSHSNRAEQNNNNNNNNNCNKNKTNGNGNSTNNRSSNNVNKKPIRQQNGRDDEIIEEFDFNNSDLDELNDNDNENTNKSDSDINQKENADGAVAVAAARTTSEGADDQIGDTMTIVSHTDSDDNTSAVVVVTADDVSAADSNDSKFTSGKRKVAPNNLDLQQTAMAEEPAATVSTSDSYCPITPRRIVDVATERDPMLHSSRTNTERTQSATTAGDSNNKDARDDDDDDYYDDEPDDELIVQFLGEANRIAEARLAARRQARAEAREIRMRELERQQKELEQNADRVFDLHTTAGIDPLSRSRLATGVSSSPLGAVLNSPRVNSMSSRRSSEDSLEEEGRSLRDIRHELKDVEERFRKAMIANAQLDNERASQTYQIQMLKDKLEEMEESYAQLQREFKEKSRDCNALKRNLDKLSEELKLVQGQLNERDALIAEQGLVIVAIENEDGTDAKRALVSVENAQLLGSVQGSLDVRLKKFSEEKQQLLAEVQKLQEQLENHKSQGKGRANSMNGPSGSDEDYEAQREANKIISDYKYKLQKAEQEIASLQASLARSETQVIRYKSTAEAAEKAEAELKIERRKLQRENREAMERLEELETSNNHLLKRLDKLKNAKSALLKDL